MAWIQLIVVACIALYANAHDAEDEKFLSRFGYYNMNSFSGGNDFTDAVKKYQKNFGLEQTGVVDEATKKEMAKPRCGLTDAKPNKNAYFKTGSKWSRGSLTYRFLNTGRDLDGSTVRSTIRRAFGMWSAVTNLQFSETSGSSSDFTIGFYSRSHGDGNPFDGKGRVLAHAFFPSWGQIHFDEDETWGINGQGIDLLWVAVHEIGHAIGLHHSDVRGTIMWPSYGGFNANIKLHSDDIAGIQSLYGRKGTGGGSCNDTDRRCPSWPSYCGSNDYVKLHCRKTCKRC